MNFKQKFYLSILLIVVVFLSLVVFCIFPSLRNARKSSEELALHRQEMESLNSLRQNFDKFEQNFSIYKEGLEEMDKLLKSESLIDPEIPVSFINFFKEQAANLNLTLRIAPIDSRETKKGFWKHMTFRVEGTGRFSDIMKFLEKMENGRWLIEENSLTMNKGKGIYGGAEKKGPDDNDYVEINLLIKVYAQG